MRESLRVGGGDARNEAALVALVVEQNGFFARVTGKLSALIPVSDGNLKSHFGRVDGGAVEGYPTLHERAEHGEEATAGAGNG